MFFEKLAELLLRYRRAAIAAFVLLVCVTTAGLSQLKVDFSFKAMIGSDDPAYDHLERFLGAWNGDEKILFVLAQAQDGTLLEEPRLSQLDELGTALKKLDVVHDTMSLPQFPMPQENTGTIGFDSIQEAAPQAAKNDPRWQKWQQKILKEQTIVPSMLSADGQVSVVLVELDFDTDDLLAFIPALAEIRAVVSKFQDKEGLQYQMAGIPAVRADVSQKMQKDMNVYTSVSFLMMFIILCFLFRTVHGVLIPMFGAMMPAAMLLGLMGWMGEPAGLVSQVYPILIPAIAVADVIHVVSRFHAEAAALLKPNENTLDPADARKAVIAAMRHVGSACFFTSVTTCIGFFSLIIADMKVMQNFGIFAGLGIALAFLTMVVAVPLMLSFVTKIPPPPEEGENAKGIDRFLRWTGQSTAQRPVFWLLVGLVVTLGSLAVASQARVDNRLSDTLPDGHATNSAGRIMDSKLGGQLALHVDVLGKPGDLIKAKTLAAFDKIEKWAKAEKVFLTTQSPATVARELNRSLTGDVTTPKTDDLAAQLFLLAQGERFLERIVLSDYSRGRMLITMGDKGAAVMESHTDELERLVADTFEPLGLQAVVTGIPFVAYKGFSKIGREMTKSLLLALFCIAIVMGFLFRNFKICVISLVPNLLPLLITLAVMTLCGWTIEATSAMVFTIGLGLAVDDSIHMLARFYEEKQAGGTLHQMMQRTIAKTGRALLITTLVLVLGFGINVFSDFPFLRIFGTLGGVAIGSALLCDLFLLPPLLSKWSGVEAAQQDPSVS
ncbi:MAG: hypothetical protein CMH56_01845 [Myxococcales bacterium]|nr:hypothetical protein [Myxococcales bacterium]